MIARIAILGAESTGKSTLAAALAAHYQTLWVPEYLREFVETEGRTPQEHEQIGIATTQVAREERAMDSMVSMVSVSGLIFCDTTPLMTAIYSDFYWGRVDAPLAALARSRSYDFTFVTAPDGLWVADGLQRESAAVQQRIHVQLLAALAQSHTRYLLLAGDVQARVQQVASHLHIQ